MERKQRPPWRRAGVSYVRWCAAWRQADAIVRRASGDGFIEFPQVGAFARDMQVAVARGDAEAVALMIAAAGLALPFDDQRLATPDSTRGSQTELIGHRVRPFG